MVQDQQTIVVGAGPVGLAAAAMLTSLGQPCLVLEKRPELSRASKASTFHPPTLEMLAELGVVSPMLEKGVIADRIQYRATSGEVIAEFDHQLLDADTVYPHRLHLEQAAMTPLLAERVRSSGRGEIRLGAEVIGVGEDADSAWVDVRGKDDTVVRETGAFVLVADGASSRVRELMGIELEGEQYPGAVLRLVVADPIEQKVPGMGQISYIFAPDGRSVSLLQMPGCWRIIIRLKEGFDEAEVVRPDYYMPIVNEFLPQLGGRIDLISHDVYRARKMLASSHGGGRIFLIGDALHLTNTRGGMNMNCGIHDAYALGLAITEAIRRGAPEIAEAAARQRRVIAAEELLPRTDRNIRGGDAWLEEVRARAADRTASREMLVRTTMLDMAPQRVGARQKELQQ